jgi:thioredoxin reductase
LKAYCAQHRLAYHDTDLPVRLDVFTAYAEAFRWRFVPNVETKDVVALERKDNKFALTLDSGERLLARHVVIATGITHFAHMPEELTQIPPRYRSHSFHVQDANAFHRRKVVVIGAGASAIDTAAELAAAGASVMLIARDKKIRWHNPPSGRRGFFSQLIRPSSGIGPGWRSFVCEKFPRLFRAMPQALRLRAARGHLKPAPAWFMRERTEGRVPMLLGTHLLGARMKHDQVQLTVSLGGEEHEILCDHVIAATGFKPDLERLPFFSPRLLREIDQVAATPVLSANFETSVRGLYVVGPAAVNSFGPLMRFMVGAEYVSPRLARHLARRLKRGGRVYPATGRTFKPA